MFHIGSIALEMRFLRSSRLSGLLLASLALGVVAPSSVPAETIPAESAAAVSLMAELAKARAETDPAARFDAFRAALLAFDQLSVRYAGVASTVDTAALLDEVAQEFLGYAAEVAAAPDLQAGVLSATREVLPRLRTPASRARFYVGLARLEYGRGDVADAIGSIRKANALLYALDETLQDEVRTGLVRLSLGISSITLDAKLRWSTGIRDPDIARGAMRAVAMSDIAARRVGKTALEKAAIRDPAARTKALQEHALTLARQGSFLRATLTALAIADDDAGIRDALLGSITETQLTSRVRPESLVALYAIADPVARETFQVRLARMAIERGRLAIARDLLGRLAVPANRCDVNAAIADRLHREEFVADWAVLWDQALANCSGQDLPDRGIRLVTLAREAAETGDLDRARKAAEFLTGTPERSAADLAILSHALAAGRTEEALAGFASLGSAIDRSQLAAGLYGALLKAKRFEEADRLRPAASEPADRFRVLVADARYGYLRSVEPDPAQALSRDALEAAVEVARAISDPLVRDGALRDAADLFADLGDLARIEALAEEASPAGKASILVIKARALTEQNRSAEALALAAGLFQPHADDAFAAVSNGLARLGDDPGAFTAAKRITRGHIRRAALRENAEIQARLQIERQRGLRDTAADGSDLAGEALSSGRFLVKPLRHARMRDLPDVLDDSDVTGAEVRRMAPAIAPGNASLVPTGFSNMNEKFSFIRYLNSIDLNGGEEQTLGAGQGTLFPNFIYIENGVFDLPSLKARLETVDSTGLSPITNAGRIYQVNVPLLIGPGASLVVSSTDVEELRLNTRANVYIVNSGNFFLLDSKLTSWDPVSGRPTPRSKEDWNVFSPFYAAWSGSKTYMADSHVVGLGYGNGKSYGITISAGPVNVLKATLDAIPRPTGMLVDTSFSSMYYAFYSYKADDVALIGNEYYDNGIYAIDPHDYSRRLLIAYNTTYGTRVKHGIITSRGVVESRIVGNVSAENRGSGIMLDRQSDNNIVAYNSSFNNGADGMTIYESSCNLLSGNRLHGNGRDGLKIRNSWDLLVGQNVMENNAGFGVNVYSSRIEDTPEAKHRNFELDPYSRYANVIAVENLMSRNKKSALRSVETATLALARNRMTVESGSLFKRSDIAALSPTLMAMTGSGASIRNACLPVRPARHCPFVEEGYFGGDPIGEIESVPAPESCQQTN